MNTLLCASYILTSHLMLSVKEQNNNLHIPNIVLFPLKLNRYDKFQKLCMVWKQLCTQLSPTQISCLVTGLEDIDNKNYTHSAQRTAVNVCKNVIFWNTKPPWHQNAEKFMLLLNGVFEKKLIKPMERIKNNFHEAKMSNNCFQKIPLNLITEIIITTKKSNQILKTMHPYVWVLNLSSPHQHGH